VRLTKACYPTCKSCSVTSSGVMFAYIALMALFP